MERDYPPGASAQATGISAWDAEMSASHSPHRVGPATVLLSSHLLDDVERVADHVAIIDRGNHLLL